MSVKCGVKASKKSILDDVLTSPDVTQIWIAAPLNDALRLRTVWCLGIRSDVQRAHEAQAASELVLQDPDVKGMVTVPANINVCPQQLGLGCVCPTV